MVEVDGVRVRLGGYILSTLNDLKEFNKHNWDNVILVTGDEGDGKTTFVKLASYYLDPNIKVNQWAYNAEQFEKIIDDDRLPPCSNIVWDESDELSLHWANLMLQTLKRKFKRIRKKRLVIWLITPTFFDMNKYFAIKRTRCLFDVYAEPKRNDKGEFEANRGRVRFFNKDKKRLLYFKGVKTWDMKALHPNFIDSFGNVPVNYPIPEAELELKKDEAMKNLINPDKPENTKHSVLRAGYVWRFDQWCMSNYNVKPKGVDFEYIFQVTDRQIRRDMQVFSKLTPENAGLPKEIDGGADSSLSKLREGVSNNQADQEASE